MSHAGLRALWKELKEWWWCRPIRCAECRGWFSQDGFWNPHCGRGLTCSALCCETVMLRHGKAIDKELARAAEACRGIKAREGGSVGKTEP